MNLFCFLAVASVSRARRFYARLREQYKLVRERIAHESNAAIAVRSSSNPDHCRARALQLIQ
jgi:hypothetical protein